MAEAKHHHHRSAATGDAAVVGVLIIMLSHDEYDDIIIWHSWHMAPIHSWRITSAMLGRDIAACLLGKRRCNVNDQHLQQVDCYDLVIIGAGASGLFASGAALSFGMKTLLLDQGNNGSYVGGDCTNSACVPSKALRSISRMAMHGRLSATTTITGSAIRSGGADEKEKDILAQARDHTFDTVKAVRKRESIDNFDNVTNLDLALVESSRFISEDEMELVPQNSKSKSKTNQTRRIIRSKMFLIATGASPIVPSDLQRDAASAGLPLYTYRDILSPESDNSAWKQFCNSDVNTSNSDEQPKHILIAGGGPTAVELAQSLVRLNLNVTLVAPTLLAAEDISLQQAACKILRYDGVKLVLGRRVSTVAVDKDVILDGGMRIKADAMIVSMGRRPTVESLDLTAAGVEWDETSGVIVHPSTLRSKTNVRVFACGDCCSAVTGKDRKAVHAAWTGYHAIRNMALPRILWAGSPSIHPTVPSVVYADPELASVGLTRSECIQKYGRTGFLYQSLQEERNDRADMERKERNVGAPFVELRVERSSGRILGLTACGPAAAELANEIGLAIQTKLTVRDLARSIHSYPSHGYPLYRLALSMTLSTTRGFLDTLGPACRVLGKACGVPGVLRKLHPKNVLPWCRKKMRNEQRWEALGQQSVVILNDHKGEHRLDYPVSFLDYYIEEGTGTGEHDVSLSSKAYLDWKTSRPA